MSLLLVKLVIEGNLTHLKEAIHWIVGLTHLDSLWHYLFFLYLLRLLVTLILRAPLLLFVNIILGSIIIRFIAPGLLLIIIYIIVIVIVEEGV